jgi:uncharacterized protein YrrD
VIPLQEVQAIGLDAIVIRSKASVVRANQVPAIQEILHHNNILRGTRILTTEGLDLGTLIDLFFDEQSGLVEGYEVSGGVFADAYSGRSFVPAPETLKIGPDVAFVPPETAQMMEGQVGGIRGAVQTTADNLQESAGAANRNLQAAAQTVSGQLQNSTEATTHRLQEASRQASEQLEIATDATHRQLQDLNRGVAASLTNRLVDPIEQKEYVIGKAVEQDVLTPDGSVLLLQGQEVTLAEAEVADRLGILDQLYRATGGSLTENMSRNFQATTESENERIQSATQRSAAAFRRSVNGLAAHAAIEQARGRRVLQTVCTEDGSIIAASGQVVTQSVLDRAQAYAKETELLSAVGLTSATAIRSAGSDTWLETKIQLRDRTNSARENLNAFWQLLQVKAEELQTRRTRQLKQQRIEQALGRPVTRVILDPTDHVILDVGELITHRAVQQAKESGVLNILLSSVYTKEPEISEKELRASVRGIAALEHSGNGLPTREPLRTKT